MDINFEYYKIFYYVAKYSNFTRAANALGNSQPNITRAMNGLEQQLHCTLFVRTNRGVQLTPEGEKLYTHVSAAMSHLWAAEEELADSSGLAHGSISIGASETALNIFLLDKLKDFHMKYPGIRLKIYNHSTPQAIDAVKSGKTKCVPERFNKIYFHWLENIKDWCISRQLWWGHQIPAFYCDDCDEMTVTKESSAVCPKCGKPMRQDPDTLDTWFSSALWPFSTLGWPDNTEELKYFYPTNTLVTGYDIIFFWVVRMMFSGLKNMGEVPFDTVLIHGLVRDEQGRKMSKSLGNGIDPLKVIDEYGADALRFMLATGNAPGNDMRYSDDKVKAARNFANKLWNASRFIMMNLPDDFQYSGLPEKLELEDRWIVSKFNAVAKEVGENLDKFEIGVASAKIYDFIWDVYCDWYIELTKPRIQAGGATMEKAQAVLVWVMRGMLKLLHPFMPYITEEIWQVLTDGESMIIAESYPVYDTKYDFADAAQFEKVIDAIRAIRNRRTEMQVPPSKKARVCIETTEPELYRSTAVFFEKLASASAVEVGEKFDMPDAATAVTDSVRIFIPMDELIDKDKELARLKKEQEKVQKDLDFLSKKLSNPGFLAKAPEKLVEAEKEKLAKAQEKMDKISQSLAALQ